MSKLDEKKEYITTLRVYLGFILAVILSFGAGLTKLYISNEHSILFFLGILVICLAMLGFLKINKTLHKEIKKLKDL
ncbi:MAG: hypothetical protein U9N33_10545 [Campylobacterota bacterium]|nr:hypothetical protein [Campylobacterota bacterium]